MVDQKLVDYIKNSFDRKIPVEEIKRVLLEKGWQESIVNEAIKWANKEYSSVNISTASKKTETKPQNLGFIFGGIFIFILLIGVLVFIMITSSGKISDTQFFQGTSVSLGENKEIRFDLNQEEHKILVESVNQNSVNLIIQSTPVNVTLAVGETKKFDLDDNDFYDLSVKLINITNAKANLYLARINESTCTENWNCTIWGICGNLSQMRVCEDLNNCSTEKNKPVETQACEDISCSGQGGTLCSSLETCNGTIINSSDGNCCSGNCTILEFVECGSIDCLITAAGTCHKSNLSYDFTSNIVGWVQTNSRYYELTGLNNGKCELYEKVLAASGVYGSVKRQNLLDEGKTEEEITSLEEEKNAILTNITGQSGTCRYSTQSLHSILLDLKEYGITLSISEASAYECTGNLYNASYW